MEISFHFNLDSSEVISTNAVVACAFFWIERTAIELQQGVYSIELELQENNR